MFTVMLKAEPCILVVINYMMSQPDMLHKPNSHRVINTKIPIGVNLMPRLPWHNRYSTFFPGCCHLLRVVSARDATLKRAMVLLVVQCLSLVVPIDGD